MQGKTETTRNFPSLQILYSSFWRKEMAPLTELEEIFNFGNFLFVIK